MKRSEREESQDRFIRREIQVLCACDLLNEGWDCPEIEVLFMDERTCTLSFKDVGCGEFFPSTGFQVEKTIHLGGINGQFNSMS